MTCLLVVSAMSTGCAARNPGAGSYSQADISRQLDKRVIDCTLPFISTHDIAHAEVRYDYHDGSVTFHTPDRALADHLNSCAAPATGPQAEFKGKIEIWPENAS